MTTTLLLQIECQAESTDPERLASALDQLLKTALSSLGSQDEYGHPTFGQFRVAEAPSVVTPRFVLFDFDLGELATTQVFSQYEDAAETANRLDNVLVIPLPAP